MDQERWASLDSAELPINLVMIVEDDADSADVLKTILERDGFKVRIAKDGGQAQATFVMQKPDFVILDLILPGESGFEICERLKHTDDAVPILIVTAIDLPESRELARKVGADGYLTSRECVKLRTSCGKGRTWSMRSIRCGFGSFAPAERNLKSVRRIVAGA